MYKTLIIIITAIVVPMNRSNIRESLNINNIKEEIINERVRHLKNDKIYLKDLRTIDSLTLPIILLSIDDLLIKDCKLTKLEIAEVVETIAMFESSIYDNKGTIPFKSPLFLKSNNAFGIKGDGHKIKTIEIIDSKEIFIESSFKSYSSFNNSIEDLVSILLRKYNLREASTEEEVFISMKNNGYFTAGKQYLNSLIKVNNKIRKLKRYDYI